VDWRFGRRISASPGRWLAHPANTLLRRAQPRAIAGVPRRARHRQRRYRSGQLNSDVDCLFVFKRLDERIVLTEIADRDGSKLFLADQAGLFPDITMLRRLTR
jgi:hypothetical protein